jgi:hypothetical protein
MRPIYLDYNATTPVEPTRSTKWSKVSPRSPLRKSVLDDDVFSLSIAKLAQPTLEFIVVGQRPG